MSNNIVPIQPVAILPKENSYELRNGQVIDRATGDIIALHSLSTEAAFAALGSALDGFHENLRQITWSSFRCVHDAIELAVDRNAPSRGRPRLGSEGGTYTMAYEKLANHCKKWSASTIKKYHMTYRAGLKCFDFDRVALEGIGCEPGVAMPILLSAIDKHQKNTLLSKASSGEIKTIEAARAAIRNLGPSLLAALRPFESTLWEVTHYDPRFGVEDFRGRTPGAVAYSVISHFSPMSGVCYFPYFGSGTEGDAARFLSRPYYGWDITYNRNVEVRHEEINPTTGAKFCSYFQWDSRTPWNVEAQSADLVFADPESCFEFGSDPVARANDLAIMAEHANKALCIGGRFAILLRRPSQALKDTFVPLQDVNLSLHTACLSKLFDPLVKIAVSTPDCRRHTGGTPGSLVCGYHDLYVYEKH